MRTRNFASCFPISAPIAALFVLPTLIFFAAAANADTELDANLDGLQVVPKNVSPAFGLLDGTLTGGAGSYVFTFSGNFQDLLGGSTAAEIRNAPVGAGGIIVFPATIGSVGATSSTISGTWRFDDANNPLTDAQAAALLAGNEYINVRSTVFPSGEIRGQIEPVPEPGGLLVLGTTGLGALRRRR